MVGLDNPLHIALVLVVVLMVFGAKRLPEMGKGLGEGMRGFKQAISGEAPAEPKAQAQPQQHLTQAQETPAVAPAETPARETTPVA